MPKTGIIDLRFPLGGVDKRYGYQDQPPHTSPDALNVRPNGTLEGRERGGSRPGLVKSYTDQLPGTPQGLASVAYIDSDNNRANTLLAISGGVFYRSDGTSFVAMSGDLITEGGDTLITEGGDTLVTGGGVASTTARIRMAERGQKIYIADYGDEIVSGSDGVLSGTNELLAPVDFTAYDIDVERDVCVITERSDSGIDAATYALESTENGKVTFLTASFTATGACSYSIQPGPKVFDPNTNYVSVLEASDGQVPTGCPLVCRYRDRLMFAGPDHIWYMSRQGDPEDWNYGSDPEDPARAIASTNADAGQVGEPITAAIPHSDDHVVFGCENSVWVMRGDPAYTGELDNLSYEYGIVNGDAWCKLPDASALVLSRSGLFMIPPGAEAFPVPFSPLIIPRELLDVNADDYISMAYDSRENGIHLSVTPNSGTGTHYWIDWNTKSFWPVSYPVTMQPVAMASFAADPSSLKYVRLASRDGYLRHFDNDEGDDDGTAIESYVLMGPFRLAGDDYRDGLLAELVGTLDLGSGDVVWEVATSNTEEGAVEAADEPRMRGVWMSGRNNASHPRVRGGAMVLKIGRTGTTRWAVERMTALVRGLGKQRN